MLADKNQFGKKSFEVVARDRFIRQDICYNDPHRWYHK